MKKGALIFGSLVALIFLGLCIVVVIAVAGKPRHFASPDEEREWARADYNSLFVDSTKPLPLLSSDPAISRTMIVGKNRVDFTFAEIADDKSKITRFGNRIDAKPGITSVKLPDGNTLRFLGVATYFPEKIHERFLNGPVDLTWHDPTTLKPLDSSVVSERNLETTTRLDLTERTLILAFDVSDPDRPHRWQSVNTRNTATLCRAHNGMRAQTREKVRYFDLEMEVFHQSELELLVSLSHGEPEIQTIDFTSLPLNQPVFFNSGNVQLKIPFRADGNKNSSSHGGGGRGESKAGFGWADAATSYQKSFVIVDCWPPVQWRQFEWKPTIPVKNRNYWRGGYGDEGLSSIDFTTKLEDTGTTEVRFFPDLTHVSFRLNSIPGLPKLRNLFEAESGPIRFRTKYDAVRFVERVTQTRATWHGDVWPPSSLPLELNSITPAEIIEKAEVLNGIQLHVNPETHTIEEWKPKPLLQRLTDWWKSVF